MSRACSAAEATRTKNFSRASANAACSDKGNPIEAEGRIQGGGVLSIERPCASAISRQGLRSAECSQPQPRSIGRADRRQSSRRVRRAAGALRSTDNRYRRPSVSGTRPHQPRHPRQSPPRYRYSPRVVLRQSGRKGRLRHQTRNLRLRLGMIPKSGYRFSEKIMLQQKAKARADRTAKKSCRSGRRRGWQRRNERTTERSAAHTFSRAVNAGSIATSSPPASLMEQLLYL